MQYTQILGNSLTSIRIGGPLAFFGQPSSVADLKEGVDFARQQDLPYLVIGGGSDLLFADEGFAGVVLKPALKTICRLMESETAEYQEYMDQWRARQDVAARYQMGPNPGLDLSSGVLPQGRPVLVQFGAGVPWGQAVSWSLKENLAGLHWFARIPCQVGGAVYNNIHGESHFFSEVICAVRTLDPHTGREQVYGQADLEFGYDYSRFHHTAEIITSVIAVLPEVELSVAAACQDQYVQWTQKKGIAQPAGPNCGSVFKNISPEQLQATNQTVTAAAWYSDECGWKGQSEGGVQVSPQHANFIVNTGEGTQADFIALVTRIRQSIHKRFGLILEPEVECRNYQGTLYQWAKTEASGSY